MKLILFGATGMIGQGVLRECLLDPEVDLVATVGRTAAAAQHAKLRQIVHRDCGATKPSRASLPDSMPASSASGYLRPA